MKTPPLEELLRAHEEGRIPKWDIEARPGQGFRISANGPEDTALAMSAIERIGMFTPEMLATMLAPTAQALAETPAPRLAGITLGDAFLAYEQTEAKGMKADARDSCERACRSFLEKFGKKTDAAEITRPKAAEWAEDLLRGGITKSTGRNYVSQIAQIFDTLVDKGRIKENPVRGVIKYKSTEKAARRAQGFIRAPFDDEQLHTLFAPQNFARARTQHVRWALVIGLFTGARAGELAQLYLRDFDIDAPVPYFRITNTNQGQSLKTPSSERLVPIHPDLVALGLLERVRNMRAAGEVRLFPDVRLDGKAGVGNAVVKGVSHLLDILDIRPRRENAMLGHHSLRKNVAGALQATHLSDDRRRALLGHTSTDVHSINYLREWKPEELALLFPGLKWGSS
jgi:integrase